MGRPRLTPEEREAKRKARVAFSLSDAAFKHYDPAKQGYGSFEEWTDAAAALATGTMLRSGTSRRVNPDLELMGLDELPEDIAVLKRAFRNAMFIHHPDRGGDVEIAKKVNLAFERLSANYH